MAHRTGRATLEVALIVIVVFVLQYALLLLGFGMELFALSMPLAEYPWTIVLAVYAHGGPGHLVANLIGLLIFGFIVERRTARRRFHAFVLLTGAIAALAEVFIGSLVGPSPVVLGISGAVFALMGYVFTSNPVSDTVLDWLEVDWRVQIALFIIVAALLTWLTAGERVALIAHFTGLVLGLIAGRIHLLRHPGMQHQSFNG